MPWRGAFCDVAALPDPVGAVLNRIQRPNGLLIRKDRRAHGRHCHHLREPPQRDQRRRRPGHQERQRLCTALRQGGLALGPRHRGGAAEGAAGEWSARDRRLPHRGHHPRQRQRADDGGGLCGSAHPPRRGRADPRLCGKRQGPLYPDRHRHLPHLRGRFRRSGQGAEHH